MAQDAVPPTERRFRGSAKIAEYEVMNEKIGEGTFGVVTKAKSRRTANIVALKKILMHNEKEGFPITALREIKLLKMLSHPNILRLEEMAVERQAGDAKSKEGKKRATLYMVTPYMDHDLSGMLTNPDIKFSVAQIKCYMLQLFEGVRYLHDSHILHRDIKAANILISNEGILQIADFGLARAYEGVPPQPGRGSGESQREYTGLVVTRWYRPPELLLSLRKYTPAIDMWGVGCVFGEMFERKPILEGKTDIDQCVRIFALVGSPTEQNMPGWTALEGCENTREWQSSRGDIDKRFGHIGRQGLDLLKQMLCLDWRKRINAIDALQHEYFTTQPLPARAKDLPRYQDSHELDARNRGHEKQRALPPAPAGGTVGMGPDQFAPAGSYQSGNGYGYNDRAPRSYNSRDQGPPGVPPPPPRGYDDRGTRARAPAAEPPAARRPQWRQDRDDRPPAPNSNGRSQRPANELPPRPPPVADGPPARGGPPPPPSSAGSRVDTYVPAYDRERDRAAPSRDYDRAPRHGSREDGYRGYRDERPVYRDADAPRDNRAPYRDADVAYRDQRGGGGYGNGNGGAEHRRTRSRSPERERRERGGTRERDGYRR